MQQSAELEAASVGPVAAAGRPAHDERHGERSQRRRPLWLLERLELEGPSPIETYLTDFPPTCPDLCSDPAHSHPICLHTFAPDLRPLIIKQPPSLLCADHHVFLLPRQYGY